MITIVIRLFPNQKLFKFICTKQNIKPCKNRLHADFNFKWFFDSFSFYLHHLERCRSQSTFNSDMHAHYLGSFEFFLFPHSPIFSIFLSLSRWFFMVFFLFPCADLFKLAALFQLLHIFAIVAMQHGLCSHFPFNSLRSFIHYVSNNLI